MRKHNIAIIPVCSIFIFILLSAVALGENLAPMPMFIKHGAATINSRAVPVGSTLIAKINGVQRGQALFRSEGEYGDPKVSTYYLAVIGAEADIGKDIEFYVKIPGLEEIKGNSTTTYTPQATIEQLDLTFTGEEVAEPSPPSPSPGGGGGGPSGAGSVASNVTADQSSYYYNIIEGNKQIDINVKDSLIALTKLQLILKQTVEGVDFEFGKGGGPSLVNAYQYISVKAPKITDDNINIAIFKFKIPNSWFEEGNYDPEKVVLWRYTTQWDQIETIYEGGDSTHQYYRAGVPGFSNFAITGEKKEVQEQTATNAETNEGEDPSFAEGLTSITGNVVAAIGGPNPVIGFTIIFAIILVGVALYFVFTRR
jgi:PGF-pre-PGF domain-containing protein